MDPEIAQINDLYRAFGLAVFQAQCLERETGMLLVAAKAATGRSISEATLDDFYQSAFKKTFGQLVKEIPCHILPAADLEVRLLAAFKIRNFLVHNYFWERAGEIQTIEGRCLMFSELDEFARMFDKLDKELTPIHREWASSLGVTDELQQKCFDELRKQTKESS